MTCEPLVDRHRSSHQIYKRCKDTTKNTHRTFEGKIWLNLRYLGWNKRSNSICVTTIKNFGEQQKSTLLFLCGVHLSQ